MNTRVFEFQFPNGDFEIDSTSDVPRVGDVIRKRGRPWSVDVIQPGAPSVVTLRSIGQRERETAERMIARTPRSG